MQKVLINKEGKAAISCPACGKTKLMDVSRFKKETKEIRLKCTCACSHVFKVTIERRRHFRKELRLEGNIHYKGGRYRVTVKDLSRSGIKIYCDSPIGLEIEDRIVLEFTLDDAANSLISKEMIVKNITTDHYGLAFTSDEHYDKLGNYMAFQMT